MPENGALTTRELAARLGKSPRTLERWRASGRGPKFRRDVPQGPVRYDLRAVERWERARTFGSTSEETNA